MKLVVHLRILLINLIALQGSLAYIFNVYRPYSTSPEYVCVGTFNDYRIGVPFCSDPTPPSKIMINSQDLMDNTGGIDPKVEVYVALDKPEPPSISSECDPQMNNKKSKIQFDSVDCGSGKVYPVVWAGIASGLKASSVYFNALVMNESAGIDKTIVAEFFMDFSNNGAKLHARVVTPKSDYYFHAEASVNPQLTRKSLKVQYVKFPTKTALGPIKQMDYEFTSAGLISPVEYENKSEISKQHPSLQKTVVVNVAQFETEFEVISVSLQPDGNKFVLTVYVADTFGVHVNPSKSQARDKEVPTASENRIKMTLFEKPFLSKIGEFSDTKGKINLCGPNPSNSCVVSQPRTNSKVQSLKSPNASINSPVLFYCIEAPKSQERNIESVSAQFKAIVEAKIVWSFEFTKQHQSDLAYDYILYSTKELHTRLNKVIAGTKKDVLCICNQNSLFYEVEAKKEIQDEETQFTINPLAKRQRRRLIAL